jgi:VPS35 endosomal protein-sorting factor-like
MCVCADLVLSFSPSLLLSFSLSLSPSSPSPILRAPLVRDYVLEQKLVASTSRRHAVKEHPLSASWNWAIATRAPETKGDAVSSDGTGEAEMKAKMAAEEQAKKDFDDPLHMMASNPTAFDDPLHAMLSAPTQSVAVDPLSASVSAVSNGTVNSNSDTFVVASVSDRALSAGFEPWSQKKARILTKYTTSARIAVSANFLDEDKNAGAAQNQPVSVERSDCRLAELEEEADPIANQQLVSQKEYTRRIREQNRNLKAAWENGERVLSLQIAIQSAKLLGDTQVPQFYPSMFVLLSEILDTFGQLVFERIAEKAANVYSRRGAKQSTQRLPRNFSHTDVPADAKETCRNWFFKTACIRELLPRLYIEMALIQCNRFLYNDPFPALLDRLSKMIRGVGDPLVASFARAYLASKALDVSPYITKNPTESVLNPLLAGLEDFLFTYRHMKDSQFGNIRAVNPETGVTPDLYVDLFSPALEWLVQVIGHHSNEEIFFALLQQYHEYSGDTSILVHLLSSFNPKYISANAMKMTTLIRKANASVFFPISKLYLALGKALCIVAPPSDQRLAILNDVWKVATKIEDPTEYCEIAVVFIEYLLRHFNEREVNIFVKDVIKHVRKNGAYKELQTELQNIVMKILSFNKNFESTLSMDNFLPLLDMLDRDTKVLASKSILSSLASSDVKASDPVILHTLFDVAKNLHDSVDSLSFSDERRQISQLIINFIRSVDFGRDLEKQLSTYVECRAAFTNLDTVTAELVSRVALLSTKAHRFMKGNHTKKTAAFVKACLAYCHITIPSLDDIFLRLHLFLTCGEVALVNQMIVQSEAFLKAAISLIPSVPVVREVDKKTRSTEHEMLEYVNNFASFLLLFPGHPQHGPFYLVKGLLNAVQQYDTWKNATPAKTQFYIGVLRLLCTYSQRNFPYHIDRVDSNDRLYGGDASYHEQLNSLLVTLIQEIFGQLKDIGEPGDMQAKKDQGTLALDFANALLDTMEMNALSASSVVKLYQLAAKNNVVSTNYLASTLRHVQQKRGSWYTDIAEKIIATTQG